MGSMRTTRIVLCAVSMFGLTPVLAQSQAQAQAEPARPAQRQEAPARQTGPVATHGEPQMRYLLELVKDTGRPGRGTPLALLRERVARAVLAHPDVVAVLATQRSAQAATREAQAAVLPSVATTVEAGHRHSDVNPLLGVPRRRYDTASVGLNLRQTMFDFGATSASVAAGREREKANAARVENRKADLALRSVQAWLEVVRSRRLLTLAQLNVQAREAMVSFLALRHELGGGPVSDVWRAQSRLAESRAAIAASQARVQGSDSAFRELFEEDPGEIDMPVLPGFDRASVAADAAGAVGAFPAVRSAAAAQVAAEHERESARARTLPQVGLEVSALRRDMIGQGKVGNEYSASVVMRYSFYTGGADTARDVQAEQRVVEAAQQTRAVRLQVERSLAQAIADDDSNLAVLAARRDGVLLAVDAMRAVREQFAYRRGSLLDMLNAQEVMHAAGVALVDAEVEQALDRWRVLYLSNALASIFNAEAAADPVR
jgi:outer membrane protein, adhesin transport system